MLKYHAPNIRTVALVGHRASGKTSLADAMLHKAHAVERLGNVDDGTSVSDFDDEEHRHHFSIDTTVLHLEHGGTFINLLDAPGYPDFVGAALEALYAVETAVIVVSATNGIETNTRRMYEEAGKRGLARIIVVNKCDAPDVDFASVIDSIRESFGQECVLFDAPVATGSQFSGVVNLLKLPTDIPKSCPIDAVQAHSNLLDAIASGDDLLLEKYLNEGDLSLEDLEAAIPRAVFEGRVVPIFCTGAKLEAGIDELLTALATYSPAPNHARLRLGQYLTGVNGHEHAFEEADENGEFLGQVFKTVNDKFVGHLSFIRVLSGKMDSKHTLMNMRSGKSSKIGHLYMIQGKTHEPVQEAYPGDIVAVSKVDDLQIGDTVSFNKDAPKLPAPVFPKPMYGLAVAPKARGDEQKISMGLHKIAEEDPTVQVTHDPQTHETIINGVSPLHLDVICHRLKERYGLEVLTHEPKVPYRETIQANGEADYRHKKQSGGRGQFGEVHLRVYPLPREITSKEQLEAEFANKSRFEKMRSVSYDPDYNFAFIDHIVGGTIPNQFIPAVEKGCRELLDRGALAGYRVQDLAVEVYFGKDHPVDSSEAAFKMAGKLALRKAIQTARPVLLEPIVSLEVTAPSRFTGNVLGDLNTHRGRVEDQDTLPGDLTVIKAHIPLAEVMKYAARLGSITQGQGAFSIEFSHYEAAPSTVQAQVVSKASVHHDDEEE